MNRPSDLPLLKNRFQTPECSGSTRNKQRVQTTVTGIVPGVKSFLEVTEQKLHTRSIVLLVQDHIYSAQIVSCYSLKSLAQNGSSKMYIRVDFNYYCLFQQEVTEEDLNIEKDSILVPVAHYNKVSSLFLSVLLLSQYLVKPCLPVVSLNCMRFLCVSTFIFI